MSRINNYEDLMLEKSRLKENLVMQKHEMNAEIAVIKEHLEPVTRLLSFFGIIKKKEKSQSSPNTAASLIKLGANAGIEVVGLSLLAKAGWVTRIIVPLVLRGLTSSVVDKIRKRFRSNGKLIH